MADSERAHRHKLEELALRAEASEIRLGQVLGFLIGLGTVLAGAYAATQGAQIAGSLIGTSGVVGLVSVFIYGRRKPGP